VYVVGTTGTGLVQLTSGGGAGIRAGPLTGRASSSRRSATAISSST
jgi:hypothetical protein